MKSKTKNNLSAVAVIGMFVIGLIGCNPSTLPKDTDSPSNTSATGGKTTLSAPVSLEGSTEDHSHTAGNFGGIIVPIGADSYHAEVVVEKSGNFRLIMLGKDESRIQEVELQAIKAYVKGEGENEATPIDLVATPQDGDSKGKTSQFVGRIPDTAVGKTIAVVIPNLKIDGERFRVGFTTANAEHGMDLPARLSNVDERELYLTPGGAYTQADIEVNGNVTASEKFKGIISSHDMFPKDGDRICPITLTKANPKFTWVVAGKPYQFCCPPCVDEFVKLAKEHPDQLKEPDTFIKNLISDAPPGSNNAVDVDHSLEENGETVDTQAIVDALAKLSAEDQQLASSQKYCAVLSTNPLGSMGTPIRIEVDGQPVFLCCGGCKGKALRSPETTLANVAKLKSDNAKVK